jgi:hypothetical protein
VDPHIRGILEAALLGREHSVNERWTHREPIPTNDGDAGQHNVVGERTPPGSLPPPETAAFSRAPLIETFI